MKLQCLYCDFFIFRSDPEFAYIDIPPIPRPNMGENRTFWPWFATMNCAIFTIFNDWVFPLKIQWSPKYLKMLRKLAMQLSIYQIRWNLTKGKCDLISLSLKEHTCNWSCPLIMLIPIPMLTFDKLCTCIHFKLNLKEQTPRRWRMG